MSHPKPTLVPASFASPTGKPPAVTDLALFASPSPDVGEVLCVTSDIDLQGRWVPDVLAGKRTGFRTWHALVALFPIAPIAGLIGALIANAMHAEFSGCAALGLVFAAAAGYGALTVFSKMGAPLMMGGTRVLGTSGYELAAWGSIGDGVVKRTIVRFDDPAQVWTVSRVNVVRASAQAVTLNGVTHAPRGTPVEHLSVRDAVTNAEIWTQSRRFPRDEELVLDPEGDAMYDRLRARAFEVRLARARTAVASGINPAFPIVGTTRVLELTPSALLLRNGPDVDTFPLATLGMKLEGGKYQLRRADGDPILVDRSLIGDVLVLEALLALEPHDD